MVSEEGLNMRRADVDALHLSGLQRPRGLDAHSSGVDNIDEYLETVTKKGDGYLYSTAARTVP